MNRIQNRLRRFVMHFSLTERESREDLRYKDEYDRLKRLPAIELSARYVGAKARYEHQRNVFAVFLVTFLLAGLSNLWEAFHTFVMDTMQLSSVGSQITGEMAKVVLIVSLSLFLFICSVILLLLVSYAKSLRDSHRRLLLIEEVKKSA